MKCKYLNDQVTIDDVKEYNGNYKTINSIYDPSYSYYRSAATTDQYNTHFTVAPTGNGEAEFESFHISLNFSSTGGIRNGKIFYKKGKYTGFDDKNLTPVEQKAFLALLKKDRKLFDSMALQFWTNVKKAKVEESSVSQIIIEKAQRNHIQRIKQTVEGELLSKPGVTAIDIDYKIVNGIKTAELAIIVFVEKKKKVSSDEAIPTSIKGIKTDIWEGTFSPYSTAPKTVDKKSQPDLVDPIANPIIGGVSVGPCLENKYGTLGIVLDTNYGPLMQSSAHVLATDPHSGPRYPISQPAVSFGGNCPNTFAGELLTWFIGQPYNIDAALATIPHRNALSNTIVQIGRTRGSDNAVIGEIVSKFGRRTQFTRGKVISDTLTVRINYPNFGQHVYYNQLRIDGTGQNQPFSLEGDSGSMIINGNQKIVGMVMAGVNENGVEYSVANPIRHIISVFEAHGVRFI